MKVEKKELAERKFTPFQITLTIEDEKEHRQLSEAILGVRREYERWWRPNTDVESTLIGLLNTILQHTK